MPVYEYYCPEADCSVEVVHGMSESLKTWADVCRVANIEPGNISPDAPVERLLYAVGVSTPQTNSELKNLGFTKLVKRDSGVYENVTRSDKDSRYMVKGDSSTVPSFKGKITD